MSAGGASVHYLMLSPLARGLFKNAISMSGSSLNWWAHITKPKFYAQKLAKHFNCPKNANGKDIIECLVGIESHELAEVHKKLFDWLPVHPGREPMDVFSPRSDPEAKVRFRC